jgi:ribosome-associated protein
VEKDLVITSRIKIPLEEFEFTFSRSGGPGGQNVNKVNTKALLRWPVAESTSLPEAVRERFVARQRRRINAEGLLLIGSQRYRDQGRNIDDCLSKLREMIAEVVTPPKPRRATRPTKASKERRLKAKRQASQKKQQRKRPRMEE